MLEQVGSSALQALRVVFEVAEPPVTRTAKHSAERIAAMVMVDVKSLFLTDLPRCSAADCASLACTQRVNDFVYLMPEPQLSRSLTEELRRVLLRVGALPGAFLGLVFRFPLWGSHDALQVDARLSRLARAAVGARFWDRSCANAKTRDRQAALAGSADARLADFVPARHTEFRDVAFQPTAAARTRVVPDPMAITFLAPPRDTLRTEATLVTLLCSRSLAPSAERALVVEPPVSVGVQAEPAATRRAAPSTRFDGQSRASPHVGHPAFDVAGAVRIQRAA